MRIISFIPGAVLAGVIHQNDPLEEPFDEPLEDLLGDIMYTPCQAALMRQYNIEIPDSSIETDIGDDEYCDQMHSIRARRLFFNFRCNN